MNLLQPKRSRPWSRPTYDQRLDPSLVEAAIYAVIVESGTQWERKQGNVVDLPGNPARGRTDIRALAACGQARLGASG